MVDRRHLDSSSFQGSEATLNDHEPFVSTGSIFQADGVIVGFNDPSAVIPCRFPDRTAVDPDNTAFCDFQKGVKSAVDSW